MTSTTTRHVWTIYYSAIREGADAIITRNCSDFTASQIEVYEPQQFLNMLTNG